MDATKTKESQTRTRLLAEMLHACRSQIDPSLEVGAGFTMADILNNLDFAGGVTGISGVYIHFNANETFSFRAMASGGKSKAPMTKTFSTVKYGLKGAWEKAIWARAQLVGYQGFIPELPPPSYATLFEVLAQKQGKEWALKAMSAINE